MIVLAILGVGGYFMLQDDDKPIVEGPTTTATAGTDVTTTALSSTAPIPAGQGVLLLSASPWGDLDKIVSKGDQKEILLADELRSTPSRIELEPGNYLVTLNGPGGRQTIDVQIQAGRQTTQHLTLGNIDTEALAKEVSKP